MEPQKDSFEDLLAAAQKGDDPACRFPYRFMSDAQAQQLAAALKTNHSIRHIDISGNLISETGLRSILQAIGPEVMTLDVSENRFGKAGAEVLAEFLPKLPHLRHLHINNCGLDDACAPILADGLRQTSTLVTIGIEANDIGKNGEAILAQGIINSGNQNLLYYNGENTGIKAIGAQNHTLADVFMRRILGGDLPDMHLGELDECLRRRHAITHLTASMQSAETEFNAFFSQLPDIPLDDNLTPEALTTPNQQGFAPLDNPLAWRQIGRLCTQMEQNGTPLSLETLLKPNRHGKPFLEDALSLDDPDILRRLNENGIHLQKDRLLDGDGNPAPLLTAAIDHGNAHLLFTQSNWQGASVREMKEAFHALPEQHQAQVPNWHALCATIGKQHKSTARG